MGNLTKETGILRSISGVCSDSNRIIQLNLNKNSTGRVSSPDYPLQYFQVTGCYWRFKAQEGYRIKLRFTTLSIEDNCKQEEKGTELIRVDDFFTTNFRSVTSFWGIFCGSVKPPVIYSTGNVLQVFFTSNYTNNNDIRRGKQTKTRNNPGFYATYELTPQGNYLLISETLIYRLTMVRISDSVIIRSRY